MSDEFDPYRKWLGIPPNEQPPTHYRLLGIPAFEDDPDVIENAANRQMAHVRTFQSGRHGALSQQLLNELSTARVCLLNPEKKAAYDAALQSAAPIPVGAPASPAAAPPQGVPVNGSASQPTPEAPPTDAGVAVGPAPVRVRTGAVSTRSTSRGKSVAAVSRGRTSVSARHMRRRSSTMPLILALVGGAIVIGIVVVVLNSMGNKEADSQGGSTTSSGTSPTVGTTPPKRRTPPKGGNRPAKPRRDRERPSRESRPSDAANGFMDAAGDAAVGIPGLPPVVPPNKPSPTNPTASIRDQQFAEAIAALRDALAKRRMDEASRHLMQADRLKLTEEHEQLVERYEAIKTYVANFWSAVRDGVNKSIKDEASFEYEGITYQALSLEAGNAKYTANGSETTCPLLEMKLDDALAFVSHGLPEMDPYGPIYIAAVLILDREAIGVEKRRQAAAQLLRKAAELAGSPDLNEYLVNELGLSADQPLGGDAPDTASPSGGEASTVPPADATGQQATAAEGGKSSIPSLEEQSDARREVFQKWEDDLKRIRRDRAHRSVLAAKLLDGSAAAPNAPQKYVMLTEARDLAIKSCNMERLLAAIDALALSFEVDALQLKYEGLGEYLKQRESEGATVMSVAKELKEEAAASDRIDLAVELLDLAMNGAKKEGDDEAFRELNIEHQDLKTQLNDRKRETP